MKTPKPTEEQLILEMGKELAKIRQSHADWVTADERRRKEFAKAFGWVKNTHFDNLANHNWQEPQLPSWEQIFVQIGKLLVLEELKQKIVYPLQ